MPTRVSSPTPSPSFDDFLTLRQAAALLGVRYEYTWLLVQRGTLPAERAPWGVWLLPAGAVHAYADQRATRKRTH